MTRYAIQPGYNVQAAQAAILHAEAGSVLSPLHLADLDRPAGEWYRPGSVPIGTVEWTRAYAARAGLRLREAPSYPAELMPLLALWPTRSTWGCVADGRFVKPLRTKAFTAGIKGAVVDPPSDPDEPVWHMRPVRWVAEWRCYVVRRAIVGVARYDDGEDDTLRAPIAVAERAIALWNRAPSGYAVDIGLLDDGRAALVEVNDGWALGYYGDCPPRSYLDCIAARWRDVDPARGQ